MHASEAISDEVGAKEAAPLGRSTPEMLPRESDEDAQEQFEAWAKKKAIRFLVGQRLAAASIRRVVVLEPWRRPSINVAGILLNVFASRLEKGEVLGTSNEILQHFKTVSSRLQVTIVVYASDFIKRT